MTKRKKIIRVIGVVLLLVLIIIWALCNAQISNIVKQLEKRQKWNE